MKLKSTTFLILALSVSQCAAFLDAINSFITGALHTRAADEYCKKNHKGFFTKMYTKMDDCTRYFGCSFYNSAEVPCKDGEQYNPSSQSCERGYDCMKKRDIREQLTYVAEETSESLKFCQQGYKDRHERLHDYSCNAFYDCSSGKSLIKTCKYFKNFNPETKLCDANYVCTHDENSPSVLHPNTHITERSFDLDTFCYEKYEKTRYENLEDNNCTSYVVCYKEPNLYYCDDGLKFNPDSQLCVENFECERSQDSKKNRKSKKIPKSKKDIGEDKSELEKFCEIEGPGFHDNVYDRNCASYIDCNCEHISVKKCIDEEKFNPKTKMCDDDYECTILKHRLISQSTDLGYTITSDDHNRVGGFCENKSDGLYADPEDPKEKFFKCGKEQDIYQCKLGLIFNIQTDWCEKFYSDVNKFIF